MEGNVPAHVITKDTVTFGAGHREEDGMNVTVIRATKKSLQVTTSRCAVSGCISNILLLKFQNALLTMVAMVS